MKYCGIIFAIPSQRHILETDDVISKYADDLQKFSKLDVVVFSSVDFLGKINEGQRGVTSAVLPSGDKRRPALWHGGWRVLCHYHVHKTDHNSARYNSWPRSRNNTHLSSQSEKASYLNESLENTRFYSENLQLIITFKYSNLKRVRDTQTYLPSRIAIV